MTREEAYKMLDQVTAGLNLPRAQHRTLSDALNVLYQLPQPPQAQPVVTQETHANSLS